MAGRLEPLGAAAAGAEAVFHYAVPREQSHYRVEFCCVRGDHGNGAFKRLSGYHGEITVDPLNGAVLSPDAGGGPAADRSAVRSDIVVEYGPVEIGGQDLTYARSRVSPSRFAGAGFRCLRDAAHRGKLLDKDNWAARETSRPC